jgi:hypothetical protein
MHSPDQPEGNAIQSIGYLIVVASQAHVSKPAPGYERVIPGHGQLGPEPTNGALLLLGNGLELRILLLKLVDYCGGRRDWHY